MSKLPKSLMSIFAMSSLLSMQMNCEIARERKFPYKPKPPKKVGYNHKEHTPEEIREKYLHKLKIKERRKRKGCRKGGRI